MSNLTLSRGATIRCSFYNALNRVDLARLAEGPRCAHCRRPSQLDGPQLVPGEARERIVAGTEVPALIDFHADWCGPYRFMAPSVDEFARDRVGEVVVGKIDTDRDP